MPAQLDVRGSGHSFAVYQGKTRVGRHYSGHTAAIAALRGIEARLAPTTTRPCLTCGTPFASSGRGHRLCRGCRAGGW